jgi:hypothetical protein
MSTPGEHLDKVGEHLDKVSELVYQALTESPWSIDTNALLTAADALLQTLQSIPDDELTMRARAMAYAALDWSVFMGDTPNLHARTRDFLAEHLAAVKAAA